MAETPAQPLTERFLDFTLTVEWELKNPNSVPTGYFKIIYPFCFPLYIQPSIIPLTEEQNSESVTVNCCIDEFFIDAAFRKPFTFTLLYSHESPETSPETFIPCSILLDGSLLFLPDSTETMISIEDFDIFSKVTFSMYCESQLLNDEIYKYFAPCFVHFTQITNMPPSSSDEAPIFFVCTSKNVDYNILSHGTDIDTVIPVEYRDQDTISFKVRNHEKYYPTEFHGSGVIVPYNGSSQPSANYGVASFDLLPERKKRSPIAASEENGGKSDFEENAIEIVYHIFDPSSDIIPIPKDRGAIARPAVEKMKPAVEEIPEGAETEASVLAREKESTKLIRWVFTCSRNDGTWSHATKILHYVQSYHAHACKLSTSPPLASVASSTLPDCSLPPNLRAFQNASKGESDESDDNRKFAFEKLHRRSKDVVTGVQIVTPQEQIIILETRGQEPMGSAKGLEHLLRSFDPASAHVLANKQLFFKPPRLFCLLDSAVSKVSLPLPMCDLLRIDGLYFPKSPNYKFYPVLTKLAHIFEQNSLAEMADADIFPTREDLIFLLSMSGVFYTIPFQKGMPPMTMAKPHGPIVANFGNLPKVAKPPIPLEQNRTSNSPRNSMKSSKKDLKKTGKDFDIINSDLVDLTESDNSSQEEKNEEKSQIVINEYPKYDMPEGLLRSIKKNTANKSSIVHPNDRLTNYSLSMTAKQRHTYKVRHAQMQRLRREEEWYQAVGDFNKSQERMSKTYDKKILKYCDGDTFKLNIGLIPVVPPSNTMTRTVSPRRKSNSQKLNSPRNYNNSLEDTI